MSGKTKTLNTRIIQKSDTDDNWSLAKNFKPLKGELIYYETSKRFKMGDGFLTVSELPFIESQLFWETW